MPIAVSSVEAQPAATGPASKAEYLYYDLGSESLDISDSRFPGVVPRFRADFDGNVTRVGVNHRF